MVFHKDDAGTAGCGIRGYGSGLQQPNADGGFRFGGMEERASRLRQDGKNGRWLTAAQ